MWLGIYALRTYIPSSVWNLADELPLDVKPVFAVAGQLLGLLGVLVIPLLRTRALNILACSFGIISIARHLFIGVDAIGPWLSILSWSTWIWFMMAFARVIADNDAEELVAPAMGAAVALQLGMQGAWHGLDLQSVGGPVAIAATALLAVALCFSVSGIPRTPMQRPDSSVVWPLLGIAFFLEATLVAHAGRFSQVTGWGFYASVILLQMFALLAVWFALRVTQFWLRVVAIAVSLIAVFALPRIAGVGGAILLITQLVVVAGLREAADRRWRLAGSTSFALGALVFFILIFSFYNWYELSPLWVVAIAPFAVFAALAQRDGYLPNPVMLAPFAAALLLGSIYLAPARVPARSDSADLEVLSYNIHHGFNDDGVPGMQLTADAIRALDADVIGFQEIGRGWNLVGGNDLIAYLQWRFPEYEIHFVPTNGRLWGNAVMSRIPFTLADGEPFRAEPGAFRYGYASVLLDGEIPFFSVHMTADLEGPSGDARVSQANELLHTVLRLPRVIVAGDFNAHPEHPPIQMLRCSKLVDLGVPGGIADKATWPAVNPNERIDYIFARGFKVQSAAVPPLTTSDHLPVLMTVSPGHATPVCPPSSNPSLQPGAPR